MNKNALLLGAACLFSLPAMADTEISGVTLPDTIALDGAEMTFNGAGVRSKFFVDLYVGSLFTPAIMSDSEQVLASDKPVAIRLNITSGMITSKKMTEAVYDGFELATNGNIDPLKSSIESFLTAFDEPIEEGDQFTFLSVPQKGIVAYKNGNELSVTPGEEFRRAVLAIWLGEKPTDEDLKEDMLSQS